MTPTEYLDACKAKMGVQSDYELGKRLDLSNAHIPAMRRGSRNVPLDIAYKIAITLELDPAAVVADLEYQREKNEKRKAFWKGFTRRAAMVAALVCTLAWSYSATFESAAGMLGGLAAVAASAAYLRRRSCA